MYIQCVELDVNDAVIRHVYICLCGVAARSLLQPYFSSIAVPLWLFFSCTSSLSSSYSISTSVSLLKLASLRGKHCFFISGPMDPRPSVIANSETHYGSGSGALVAWHSSCQSSGSIPAQLIGLEGIIYSMLAAGHHAY
jgi:hypothetical protein